MNKFQIGDWVRLTSHDFLWVGKIKNIQNGLHYGGGIAAQIYFPIQDRHYLYYMADLTKVTDNELILWRLEQ